MHIGKRGIETGRSVERLRVGFHTGRAAVFLLALVATFAGRIGWSQNVVSIGAGRGTPGDLGIPVIITARNTVPIHGFSLALSFPAEALSITSFDVEGTHVESLDPDLVAPSVDNGLGVATLGVIFNYDEPIGTQSFAAIPQNSAQRIVARLVIDVKADAPGGLHELRLVDGVGQPAAYNRFTNAGVSVEPNLESGTFFVGGGNVTALEKQIAFAGPSVNLPILAFTQHPKPIDGFSIAVRFRCSALELLEVEWTNTDLGFLLGAQGLIDFFQSDVDDTIGNDICRSRTAVIFDYPKPAGHTLQPSTSGPYDQSILRYRWRVDASADDENQFQDLILDNREEVIGSINNIFVVGTESILPHLIHGKIYFSTGTLTGRVVGKLSGAPVGGARVTTDPDEYQVTTAADGTFQFDEIVPGTYNLLIGGPDLYNEIVTGVDVVGSGQVDDAGTLAVYRVPTGGGPTFRRAFVNADRNTDLADAIFLLDWLFRGGTRPACLMAADVNGDQRNNLSDTIWLLEWLFSGGPPPPEPRISCGTDPASDLGCEFTLVCP